MRYRWRDLPALLGNPVGRHQLALGQLHLAFPLSSAIARAYRRTVIAGTRIVSIIGSEGKSTTARAVSVALGNRLFEGIEINELALLPFQVLRIPPGRRHAVIETAIDAPGQMARFARMIRPQVCVATTIGTEHLHALGTIEAIVEEKSRLVRALPADGIAVLNGDDPKVLSMAQLTQARVVTYGLGEANDVRATELAVQWPDATGFTVHCGATARRLECPGIDLGVVYSAVAAIAVAHAEGVSIEDASARLEKLPPTPGRMEIVRLHGGAVLLCDYCHASLAGTFRALDALERFPGRRKIVVLGDLHEVREDVRETHRRVGARVAAVAERAFLVSGSGETAKCYRAGAASAGLARDRITVATRDVPRVIEMLKAELQDGDVVLIRGRTYQRLDRIALALTGREVRCGLPTCRVPALQCRACRMLGRDWERRRPVF